MTMLGREAMIPVAAPLAWSDPRAPGRRAASGATTPAATIAVTTASVTYLLCAAGRSSPPRTTSAARHHDDLRVPRPGVSGCIADPSLVPGAIHPPRCPE